MIALKHYDKKNTSNGPKFVCYVIMNQNYTSVYITDLFLYPYQMSPLYGKSIYLAQNCTVNHNCRNLFLE